MTATASRPVAPGATEPSRRSITALFLIAVGALWMLPLRSSLWMDELGTYWVIKDGFRETVDRAWNIQGQTPLYYVVEWTARVVFGNSELALRLPSFVAMLAAAYVFHRLVRRLTGREAGLTAVVIFAVAPSVGFLAADARPYALATLTVVTSTLFLVRWLDMGRPREGFAYILFTALTVYVHYIFALALLSHVAYAIARRDRVRAAGVVFALGGTAALLAPAIPQLLNLLQRSGALSVPATGAKATLFQAFAPPALIAGGSIGLLVSHLIEPIRMRAIAADRATLVLGASWLVVAPVILFVVSSLTPVSIFADRYLVTAVPGFALLAAMALSAVARARARVIALAGALACALVVAGTTTHTTENWRAALERIDSLSGGPQTPVLVHGALIESKQISWLTDPEKATYLNGPTTYYQVTGRTFAMPYSFDDAAQGYLEGLLPSLRASGRFFYVTRYLSVPTPQWLLGRLDTDGFGYRTMSFGRITVFEFRRG